MAQGFKVDLTDLTAAGTALVQAATEARATAGQVHTCRTDIEFTDGCTLDDLLVSESAPLPLRTLEASIAHMVDAVERRQKHLADEVEYAGKALLNIKALYARADGQES